MINTIDANSTTRYTHTNDQQWNTLTAKNPKHTKETIKDSYKNTKATGTNRTNRTNIRIKLSEMNTVMRLSNTYTNVLQHNTQNKTRQYYYIIMEVNTTNSTNQKEIQLYSNIWKNGDSINANVI